MLFYLIHHYFIKVILTKQVCGVLAIETNKVPWLLEVITTM